MNADRGDGRRDQDLAGWVRADFGLDLVTLEPVDGGADALAELWQGRAVDGARYAVKLTAGGSEGALLVAAALADAGVVGIPAPLRTVTGRPCTDRPSGRLSVLPWVSDLGALDEGAEMARRHWVAFGRLLSAVHRSPVTDDLAALLPRERHHQPALFAAVRDLDRQMATIAAGRDPAAWRDPVARAAAVEWTRSADRVRAVRERAERLSGLLQHSAPPAVICHADPHLGNLLLGEGSAVWLVDWDDALLAPPETDLIFVLGGVLADEPVTEQQQAWFFQGYGPVQPDADRLAYYRAVRALVDVGDFAAMAVDLTGQPVEQREWALAVARACLWPTGQVQRALDSAPAGATGPAHPEPVADP